METVLVPSALVAHLSGGRLVRSRFIGPDAARLARLVPRPVSSVIEGQVGLVDPAKVAAARSGTWCEVAGSVNPSGGRW